MELEHKAHHPTTELGHGERRNLELGITLALEPRLILLDEPTAGMSMEETSSTIDLVKKISHDKTVVFTEHDMSVVFSIADRISVLHQGSIIAEGNARRDSKRRPRSPRLPGRRGLILTVEKINTFYGDSHILFDVDMSVAEGEVVSLLGRNGAGKTTTLRSIMGLTPPREGCVRWLGEEVQRLKPHEIARKGLGFVPEDRRIFSRLSVEENLEIGAFKLGAAKRLDS